MASHRITPNAYTSAGFDESLSFHDFLKSSGAMYAAVPVFDRKYSLVTISESNMRTTFVILECTVIYVSDHTIFVVFEEYD